MPANNVTCDPHIIAVFGGGTVPQEVLRFAQDLGRAIADRGQILLTGGRGRPNVQKREDGTSLYAVKTCAIAGVGSRPWIGVDRTVARWDANPVPERGLLIDTPLKHRRNFLEAKMCDAAIVLEGDVGTRSELAAALLLDRPVAIVGLKWEDTSTQLRDDPAKTLGLLREAMIAKFGDTPDEALDYAPATLRRPREGALTYEWFGSPMPTASHVVDRVLSKLPCSARLSGRFPRTLHEGVFTEYEKWLEETPMTVAQVGPDPH